MDLPNESGTYSKAESKLGLIAKAAMGTLPGI